MVSHRNSIAGNLQEEIPIGSATYSTLDGKLVLATESEHFGKRIGGAD
jgi:hypothetical protein